MKKSFLTHLIIVLCVIMGIVSNHTLVHANTEDVIDQYVMEHLGTTTPGLAIAIVKDGKIIMSKGYGYANVEEQILVDPQDTVFEWASMSKLFTWISVMQLVEQDKLDLDTNIKEYLPSEFSAQLEYEQPITLRNIMNHSAGFGDYAFNAIVFSPADVIPLEKAILRDKPKQYYEVGSASAYSNYATAIAGYIVECVENQPYEEYVRNNIFDVLSMDNTTAYPSFEDRKELQEKKAHGYLPNPKGGFVEGKWSYVSLRPAGSINGTVEDLAKFAIALTPSVDQKSALFFEENTISTLFSPSYDETEEMVGTAHGFFEYVGEYPTYGHGGNTAAFSVQFAVVPEERIGIAVLTNAYLEMDLIFGIQDILLGKNNREFESSTEALPSTEEVQGIYIPMERQEGNFVDFAKYMGLYKINSIDTNKISMNIGPYQGTYMQTKPYYYELIDDNIPLFRNVYPILRFETKNNKVEHIIVGNGMDLSALPPGRTMPFLKGSVIALLTSILFFLGTLIMSLVKNKKSSKRQELAKSNRHQLVLSLLGIIIIVNNLIPCTKIMINNFQTFDVMRKYIALNYILFIGSIILSLGTWKYFKSQEIPKSRKSIFALTIGMFIVVFGLLLHWNFFVM